MENREDTTNARVLVVDDEPANVLLIERILARAGYDEVLSTTDPREVLPMVESFEPDLILLDLVMPRLNGFQVMDSVRTSQAPRTFLPIVVLTADVTDETRTRALEAGANDFLTKPFDATEVLLRIHNLLQTRFLYLELQGHKRALEAKVRERTRELEENLDLLRATDASRRQLLSSLVSAQEDERRRIAGDIHDDSVQLMTAMGIRLQMLRKRLGETEETERIKQLEDLVSKAVGRLRYLVFELRPPALDRDGLAAALNEMLQIATADGAFAFRLDDRMTGEPPTETKTIMFRILQEALANVRKHADAKRVDVLLECSEGGFKATVRDDGRGFEDDQVPRSVPGHLGLLSMRERAEMAGGRIRVDSHPGKGTFVECWLPADGLVAPRVERQVTDLHPVGSRRMVTGSDQSVARRT